MLSFRVNSSWAVASEIVPGLYICGVTALNAKTLTDLDINLIVNCTVEVPNLSSMAHCDRIKLWLEDCDEADLSTHLDYVCDHIQFVLSNGGRVLVHCVAGVSRSAALCLAYLIKYESYTLRQAYRLMAARRPMVRPNLGFWKQLIQYEKAIRPDRAPSVCIVSTTGNISLPDVYIESTKMATDQIFINTDLLAKRRHSSGSGRIKFVPRLDSLPEH